MKKMVLVAALSFLLANLVFAGEAISLNKDNPASDEEVYFVSSFPIHKVYFANLSKEELAHFSGNFTSVREFASDPVRAKVFRAVMILPHLIIKKGGKFPFPPTNFVMVTAHETEKDKIITMRIYVDQGGQGI